MYYNDDEYTGFGKFVIGVLQVASAVSVVLFIGFLFFRYAT